MSPSTRRIALECAGRRGLPASRRSHPWSRMWRLLLAVGSVTAVLMQATTTPVAQAAGVDPLPAVASALAHVRSYEVSVTTATTVTGLTRPPATGTPRAGSGQRRGRGAFRGLRFGPGTGTQTIIAIRQGNAFEDYVVAKGTGSNGKPATQETIFSGNRICYRSNGKGSFSCQTMQQSFNFNPDPTAAFEGPAGSAVFTPAKSKTIDGQSCDGYTYMNKLQNGTASGVVYIGHSTHLPCEQLATNVRHGFGRGNSSGSSNSTATFTQKSTYIWSHFNDSHLKIPSVPAA